LRQPECLPACLPVADLPVRLLSTYCTHARAQVLLHTRSQAPCAHVRAQGAHGPQVGGKALKLDQNPQLPWQLKSQACQALAGFQTVNLRVSLSLDHAGPPGQASQPGCMHPSCMALPCPKPGT